jgi:hypothetical protein
MGDPAADGAVGIQPTEEGLGDIAGGLGHELDGGELDRLVVEDPAGEGVSDAHLDRDGHGADAERDQEAHAVVAVSSASQHRERVHGRDEQAAHHVGRDHHVGGHQRHGVVEDH